MEKSMKATRRILLLTVVTLLGGILASAQAPDAGRGPARPVLSVTSPAFPDGGEVPMRNAGRGENKSPAFEFHWNLGTNSTSAPDTLQTYAVVFHDIENSSNKTTTDTLHWTAFNISGSAKGIRKAWLRVISRMERLTVLASWLAVVEIRRATSALAPAPARFITMSSSSTPSIRSSI
jgi:hypothetical protein